MKRDDISRIFENATKEQIDAILNINSADINKAKGDFDTLTADLTAARQTISDLEANKGNVDELQKQIDAYKQADEQRRAAEKAAQERAELSERMAAAMGDRKFLHDRLHDAVLDDFKAALSEKTNIGKADKEVFDAITQDKGYFASQAPNVPPQPPVGDIGGKPVDREAFFKMSFGDQMKFKAERPTEFAQLFNPTNN